MPTRQCPHCGKEVSALLTQCVYCREALPAVPKIRGDGVRRAAGASKIRQGLLFMLLAALVHFFSGGYSALELPFQIQPIVTGYFSPLLFLSGLGLSCFGFYLQRSA
jgi:hypothetical protein